MKPRWLAEVTRSGRGWVAVSLAQLPLLGLLALLAANDVGWARLVVLFLALPPLFVAHRALRPRTGPPGDRAVDDWGTTDGYPWVASGDDVWFLPKTEQDLRRASVAPVTPEWTHAGFRLEVPPHGSGRPPVSSTVEDTLYVLVASGSLGAIPWLFLDAGGSGLLELVVMAIGVPIGLAVFWFALLIPSTALLALLRIRPAPAITVELAGRTVRTGDASFQLGGVDQAITHVDGTLVLIGSGQELTLRGRAAHLAFLAQAFTRVSVESGTEAEVPEALRGMRASGSRTTE